VRHDGGITGISHITGESGGIIPHHLNETAD